MPGATSNIPARAMAIRMPAGIAVKKYPATAVATINTPMAQLIVVLKNELHVKYPSITINITGESTKTIGTLSFAIPNENAESPVLKGLAPAIPAAAYADAQTGGVISEITP